MFNRFVPGRRIKMEHGKLNDSYSLMYFLFIFYICI